MRIKGKKKEGTLVKSMIALGYVAFIIAWWFGVLWVDIFNDVILIYFIMATILFVDSVVCIIRRINGGHADYMSEEEIAERLKRRNIVNWIRFAIGSIIAGYIAYNLIISFVRIGYFEKAMFVFMGFIVFVCGYIDSKIRRKVTKVQYKLCVVSMIVVVGIVLVFGAKNIGRLVYGGDSQEIEFIEKVKYPLTATDMGNENERAYFNYIKKESFLADEFYTYIDNTYVDNTGKTEGMIVTYIDLRSESFVPLYMKCNLIRERRKYSNLKEYETTNGYEIHYIEGNFDNIAFVTIGDQVLFIRWSFGEIEDGVKAIDKRMGELVD